MRILIVLTRRLEVAGASVPSPAGVVGSLAARGHEVRVTDEDDPSLGGLLLSWHPEAFLTTVPEHELHRGAVGAAAPVAPWIVAGRASPWPRIDRAEVRRVLGIARLPLARHRILAPAELRGTRLSFPSVVKTTGLDRSATSHARGQPDLDRFLARLGDAPEPVLVERFVPGRSFKVAVLGDRALGPVETPGRAEGLPPPDPDGAAARCPRVPDVHPISLSGARSIAIEAHGLLGGGPISLVSLRYDDTCSHPGELNVVDVDTSPSVTPTSTCTGVVRRAGLGFLGFAERVLAETARRPAPRPGR
jgi:D-alanine-D-alanine ligase-like ATP-grasp enzyme